MGELLALWKIWWLNGKLPDTMLLWDRELTYWGRLGAIIQIIAGLFLIAEVIGAENIRKIGKKLDGRPLLTKLTNGIILILNKVAVWFTTKLTGSATPQNQTPNNPDGSQAISVTSASIAMLAILAAWFALYPLVLKAIEQFSSNPFFIPIGIGVVIILSIIPLFMVALLLLTMLGAILDKILFQPLGHLMDRPDIERIIKGISIVVFLIGSHFSLLAQ